MIIKDKILQKEINALPMIDDIDNATTHRE